MGVLRRALGAGTVAGVLAVAGLVVLQRDADPLYRELIAGPGVPAVTVSGAAGVSALVLVLRRRFQLARFAAALAVAAIVAGWALAQQPQLVPGLTVDQAAAPRDIGLRPGQGIAGPAVSGLSRSPELGSVALNLFPGMFGGLGRRDEMRSRSRVMHRTVAESADTVEQAHHVPRWPENPHDPADARSRP